MAKRKALCVAIDDYGHPANNLNSCIADAQAFEQLLRSTYGFEEVHALHNERATIKNVEEDLGWLFEDAEPDDRLVFLFSGHGYQLPNNDVLEEVLVLQDGFFQDNRLSELSQHLSGQNLTIVLDSCFSGGMEKILILSDEGIEVARPKRWTPTEADQLQKEFTEIEKAVTMKLKPFGAAQPVEDPAVLSKFFGFTSPAGADMAVLAPAPPSDEHGQQQLKGLMLSACLENETASAMTSKTNGLSAFTFGITEALKEVGPNAATSDLLTNVVQRLKTMGFRQTPLMKAPPNAMDIGDLSFLMFESVNRPKREEFGKSDIEQIIDLIRNALEKVSPMPMTESQISDEKFLGAIIGAVASVAPHVLPHVINAFKDFQPGLPAQPTMTAGQPAGNGNEKIGLAFLSALPLLRNTGIVPPVLQPI
jgi:hypothetical protein